MCYFDPKMYSNLFVAAALGPAAGGANDQGRSNLIETWTPE